MQDGILSIQSAVAYGHVGNSAAVFPLQRLGFEVWPVNTVLFSNHTGYGAWRGRVVGLDWVEEIIEGIAERGAIPHTRAVLSGYLGDPSLGEAVLRVVARVRAERPDMLYACDPVMGDEGRGFFVKPGIPEFFRDHAVPAADIVTPNQFELAWLAGGRDGPWTKPWLLAPRFCDAGPGIVVCTSGSTRTSSAWTPRLPITLNGTGDAFTALFLGSWLKTGRLDATLEHAVAAMYALVDATYATGSRELELIAAQDQLLAPARYLPRGSG